MASFGRLIRVRKASNDSDSVAYIVAVPEATKAIEVITAHVAGDGDAVEDLGRVSEELLRAIGLHPGKYVCTDATSSAMPGSSGAPSVGDLFTCPTCQTSYRISRKSEPSDREPRCEECDEELPDNDGDEWLHYERSPVVTRCFER